MESVGWYGPCPKCGYWEPNGCSDLHCPRRVVGLPDWHDDKEDELAANRHTATGAGDLDLAGRPMRQGS
jgi:hypothetical protein